MLADLRRWLVVNKAADLSPITYSAESGDWSGYAFVADVTYRKLEPATFLSFIKINKDNVVFYHHSKLEA